MYIYKWLPCKVVWSAAYSDYSYHDNYLVNCFSSNKADLNVNLSPE